LRVGFLFEKSQSQGGKELKGRRTGQLLSQSLASYLIMAEDGMPDLHHKEITHLPVIFSLLLCSYASEFFSMHLKPSIFVTDVEKDCTINQGET